MMETVDQSASLHEETDGDVNKLAELAQKQIAITAETMKQTVADKVKVKRPFPYLLYFHQGLETRNPCDEDDFNDWRMTVQEHVFQMAEEGKAANIKVEWAAYWRGKGLVGCLDEYTHEWCKNSIKNFTNRAGDRFRGWSKGEAGEMRAAQVAMGCNLRAKSAASIMKVAVLNNNLDGKFIIGNSKPWEKGGPGGRIQTVYIDRLFAACLEDVNNRPTIGMESIRFYYRPFPRGQNR